MLTGKEANINGRLFVIRYKKDVMNQMIPYRNNLIPRTEKYFPLRLHLIFQIEDGRGNNHRLAIENFLNEQKENSLMIKDRLLNSEEIINLKEGSTENIERSVTFTKEKISFDMSLIPDITPDVTENLLRYFHSEDLCLMSTLDGLRLMEAAEKLNAPDLIGICLLFLLQNLNERNVLDIYHRLKRSTNITENCDSLKKDLINRCLNIIDIHAEDIIKVENFMQLDLETMDEIISRQTLQAPKMKILEALNNWASKDCKCCLLLNGKKCSILGERAYCSHHIVIKNSTITRTTNNVSTSNSSATLKTTNLKCVNKLQNNQTSNRCIETQKIKTTKKHASARRKIAHGLAEFLTCLVKLFD